MPDWDYEMGAGLADRLIAKRSSPEPARTIIIGNGKTLPLRMTDRDCFASLAKTVKGSVILGNEGS